MNSHLLIASAFGLLLFFAGVVLPLVQRPIPHPGFYRLPPSLQAAPSIEVVVPAYLEASGIGAKIGELDSALAGYPGRSSITVMASDAETATAAEHAKRAKVVLCGRKGKPAALNEAVADSDADIVVFTDANCVVGPENWPLLVVERLKEFSLVSANKSEQGSSDLIYWAYERLAKGTSRMPQASLGVVGEFVALRRTDFRPLPTATLLDDMVLAIEMADRGLASCVDPSITTLEDAPSQRDQWGRRTRICEGVLRECSRRFSTLIGHPLGRRLLLHKFYRMTAGCLGFWIAISGLALGAPPPIAALIVGVVVVSVASYSGWIRLPSAARSVTSPIGLQAVPLAAVVAIIGAKVSSTAGESGWSKIPR